MTYCNLSPLFFLVKLCSGISKNFSSMLGVLSAVVGLMVLLWMFYDFIWPPPPSVDRQLGKPDQPIEYNLRHNVSYQTSQKNPEIENFLCYAVSM